MNRTTTDLGLLFAVLAGVTGLAALLGAANFGTALSFGTMAFAVALVWTMTRD
jgi:DMSO reductase anchor subunit